MSHTRSIRTGDTDVTLIATVYNTDGSVRSDLAWNTAGISIFVQRIGMANGTPLTLSNKATPATAHVDGQFLNLGGGNISVDIPDAPLANFIGQIRIYGTFTGGSIIGDWYDVVGYDATAVAVGANTTTPPTASAIADQVYEEQYSGHNTPGTYGFLWDKWRKNNPSIVGEVTNAIVPTTSQFSTDITGYGNEAFVNAVLIFINGSTNADFRMIIANYTQTNGIMTITPPLPTAPVVGDEFTIAIPSFVYTLAQIQSGLATSSQATDIKSKTDRIPDNPATSEQITSLQSNSPSEAF